MAGKKGVATRVGRPNKGNLKERMIRNIEIFESWNNGEAQSSLCRKHNITPASVHRVIKQSLKNPNRWMETLSEFDSIARVGEVNPELKPKQTNKQSSVLPRGQYSLTRCSRETADRIINLIRDDIEARITFFMLMNGKMREDVDNDGRRGQIHGVRKGCMRGRLSAKLS